jgi:hypothetical protein
MSGTYRGIVGWLVIVAFICMRKWPWPNMRYCDICVQELMITMKNLKSIGLLAYTWTWHLHNTSSALSTRPQLSIFPNKFVFGYFEVIITWSRSPRMVADSAWNTLCVCVCVCNFRMEILKFVSRLLRSNSDQNTPVMLKLRSKEVQFSRASLNVNTYAAGNNMTVTFSVKSC